MKKRSRAKKLSVSWIDPEFLLNKKVKRYGRIGGCIVRKYAVTDDGKVYFIKLK